ncbi:sugar porter family MFS transporter [Saccharopolyspora pogona]|uniref:sugar porter family MFS transporter n=1 Tax=Saccharopolyspora pogona TaxID=333966 RepID=UPI001CC23D4E|nr:sugar porter family MFS transporter [Saccharopolyspora pogona]
MFDNPSPEPSVPSRSCERMLVKVTAIVTLGGFLFGYDTGVISGALLYMQEALHLNTFTTAAVVSALLFGAMFGALLGGRVADLVGRRRGLLSCAVLFAVGSVSSGLAPNAGFVIVARFVLGLAVGTASATVPIYLSEMAPADRRGRMVTINELMIVTGILTTYLLNAGLGNWYAGETAWRWMLAVSALPAVGLFLGTLLLPDTPRWYAMKGRYEDSKRVLLLTRDPATAEEEFGIIAGHARRSAAEYRASSLRVLREQPWMRRMLWVGVGLATAGQTTGINTVEYYGPTILESTGLTAGAALVSIIAVGVTSVSSTAFGIWLLGFMSRRPLLITGFAGVTASLVILAVSFLLPHSAASSYLVLLAMVLFVAIATCFLGIGIWLLLSEIFPLAIRGLAMGVAVFALWAANTLVSFVFPLAVGSAGPTWAFAAFALINAAATVFTILFVPETRGRTLEQLEDEFRERHSGAR